MKVVLTGGGTGGHLTPLKPLIDELVKKQRDVEIVFIGQTGDRFADLIANDEHIQATFLVRAGKYRRYPNESFLQRLADVRTHLLNLRDLFRILLGLWQSNRIIKQIQPDVVFGNGGYVTVPVGLAASWQDVPLVIHESDAHAGIASRILAKRAEKVLFGMPIQHSAFRGRPASYVGIPLRDSFTHRNSTTKKSLKKMLGFSPDKPLLLVTGGSLGAQTINTAITSQQDELLRGTQIAHVVGKDHYSSVAAAVGAAEHYQVIDYTDQIDEYMRAADVVVTRASATTFNELAALGKATILVPGKQLLDQQHNAARVADQGAAIVVSDSEIEMHPEKLRSQILELLGDKERRKQLEERIKTFSKTNAAGQIASVLTEVANA